MNVIKFPTSHIILDLCHKVLSFLFPTCSGPDRRALYVLGMQGLARVPQKMVIWMRCSGSWRKELQRTRMFGKKSQGKGKATT